MTKSLEKTIEDLIPKSIDDIIRNRKDECSIRLAKTHELMKLAPMVSMMNELKPVKAIVDDWKVICITLNGEPNYFLIGERRDRNIRNNLLMTSRVKSIDFASNMVLTNNSIYQLGTKAKDEPKTGELLHICATLTDWGLGSRFGVPSIFY